MGQYYETKKLPEAAFFVLAELIGRIAELILGRSSSTGDGLGDVCRSGVKETSLLGCSNGGGIGCCVCGCSTGLGFLLPPPPIADFAWTLSLLQAN